MSAYKISNAWLYESISLSHQMNDPLLCDVFPHKLPGPSDITRCASNSVCIAAVLVL